MQACLACLRIIQGAPSDTAEGWWIQGQRGQQPFHENLGGAEQDFGYYSK